MTAAALRSALLIVLTCVACLASDPARANYDTAPGSRFVVDIVMRSASQPTPEEVSAWLNDVVLVDPQHAALRVPLANISVTTTR